MKSKIDLNNALSKLKNAQEAKNFLRDLLTPAEIDEFSTRFQIAQFLWTTKLSYAEIAKKLNTSTTTVTRVARFLYKEPYQGYSAILERLYGKSSR